MKTLLFLRHGKSDWDADYQHDHDRPLAKRGVKAARKMGRFMAGAGLVPGAAVTSSAVRARRTLEVAREAGGWTEVPVRVTDDLYDVFPGDVLEVVRREPEATEVLLLVGHEPTWSETISALIGGGQVRYPTAALARVDLDVGAWQNVAFGLGQLQLLLPPKLLP